MVVIDVQGIQDITEPSCTVAVNPAESEGIPQESTVTEAVLLIIRPRSYEHFGMCPVVAQDCLIVLCRYFHGELLGCVVAVVQCCDD